MNFQKHSIRVYNRETLEYLLVPYNDCTVCLDYPMKPIITLCGHVYCHECAFELLEHKRFCMCGALLTLYIDVQFIVYDTDINMNEYNVKKQIEAYKAYESIDEKQSTGIAFGNAENDQKSKNTLYGYETCIMRYGSFECDLISNLTVNPIAARYQIDEEYFITNLGNNNYESEEKNYKKSFREFFGGANTHNTKADVCRDFGVDKAVDTNDKKTGLEGTQNINLDRSMCNKICPDTTKPKAYDGPEETMYTKNEATQQAIKRTKNKKLMEALYKTVTYQKYNGEPLFMSKKSMKELRKNYSYKNMPEYIEVAIISRTEMIYKKADKYFEDGYLQHLCEGRAIIICDVCFDP